ncbi:MAG: glycosyltransferase family 4 protein [Gammaproteobacteria bacterium]|nr:glycosyltransferase family 4 protein [Gammaproteobacteria bacterium]
MVYLLSRTGSLLRIIDHPNERSLHQIPTPRTGGLGIWVGSLAGLGAVSLLFGEVLEVIWLATGALIIAIISFIDDRLHVPVRIRLSIHLLAAITLVIGGLQWQSIELPGLHINLPPGITHVLSVLFIIWMTNLYNFMDGMDGLAGGMAVFGFGTLGMLGHLAGDDFYAAMCWMIAASSAGFLVWNFPPARIFMGDTGSSVLGLLAAALSLWADRDGLFPLWTAMLIFAPFVFDATLTLARRTLQGERIWEAHRSHYYQRLVQAGWSHRRTVLWEYGLMLLCSAGAFYAFRASTAGQWMIIGMILSTCLAGVVGVRHIERRHLASRMPKISL